MILNEEFDDEVADDDSAPVEPGEPKDPGDFKRVLAGREIWFNSPKPGQVNSWRRYQQTLAKRYEKIRVRAQTERSPELLGQLQDMSEKFDLSTIELVESMLVSGDDVDFIAMEMISGNVTVSDLHVMLFSDAPEPEDDVEPVRATPKRKQVKKAANVNRTRK